MIGKITCWGSCPPLPTETLHSSPQKPSPQKAAPPPPSLPPCRVRALLPLLPLVRSLQMPTSPQEAAPLPFMQEKGAAASASAEPADDREERLLARIMSKLEAARDPVKKAVLEGKLNKLLANMQASASAAAAAAAEAAAKKKPPAFQFKPTASSSQSPGIQSILLTVAEQRRRQQRHSRSACWVPPHPTQAEATPVPL